MITKSYLKIALLLISLIVWGSSSLTLAQTEPTFTATQEVITESKTWFTISSSLHYLIPSLDLQIGVEDALGEGIDLRTTLSGFWSNSNGIDTGFIALGLNGLIEAENNNPSIKDYLGFGPRFLYGFNSTYSSDGYEVYDAQNNTVLAIGGLWGSEYNAQGSIRPYYEINGSLPVIIDGHLFPAFIPVLSISTGFNFYF